MKPPPRTDHAIHPQPLVRPIPPVSPHGSQITIEDCLFPGLTADDPAALPVPYINVATLLHNARRRVKVCREAGFFFIKKIIRKILPCIRGATQAPLGAGRQ